MTETNEKSLSGPRGTAAEWDVARKNFATSLMVDTKLLSLSQNLEIREWPIRGEDETPSKYIDFTWEELNELPGLADKPERIDLLIQILTETLAFDDPFGDMVATVDASAERDDTLMRNLRRLKVPGNFPLSLSGLSADTREFCKGEEIETLEGFARFCQNMAQNVVVGGDFRHLLNAIQEADEPGLAQYIPIRSGKEGIFLPEAIGLFLKGLSDSERLSMLQRYGFKLDATEQTKARLDREQVEQLESIIVDRIRKLWKMPHFEEQGRQLREQLAQGGSLERYFMVLDDPQRELICVKCCARFLNEQGLGKGARETTTQKRGLFSRLFGRR